MSLGGQGYTSGVYDVARLLRGLSLPLALWRGGHVMDGVSSYAGMLILPVIL